MAKYLSRQDWQARNTNIKAIGKVSKVFIHHTVSNPSSDPAKDAREIQNFHMNSRGYADIAYTWLVHPDGTVIEGRMIGDKAAQGAHTLNHNSTSIAISAIGNYEENEPSETLMQGMRDALQYAKNKGQITDSPTIRPHKDVYPTQCAGKYLIAKIGEIGGGSNVTAPPVVPVVSVGGAPAYPGLLKKGSRGDNVRMLQQRLQDRGWSIKVDSDFGPATEKIVQAYQKDKRLTVDGLVGPQTWHSIFTSPIT